MTKKVQTPKFEVMLERLVNGDRKGAEELFHDIIVEQSRSIYEKILKEDVYSGGYDDFRMDGEDTTSLEDEFGDPDVPSVDPDWDAGFDDEEFGQYRDRQSWYDSKEASDLNKLFEEEDEDLDLELGGDSSDDLVSDSEVDLDAEMGDDGMNTEIGGDDMGNEGGDIEDRVVDLEDAFDELKSEFSEIMSELDDDDEGEEESDESDDSGEGDDGLSDIDLNVDAEGESEGEGEEESDDKPVDENRQMSETEIMREYVNKINQGLSSSETAGTNTKSTVAGKNNMGGKAHNIVRTDTESEKKPKVSVQKMNTGNVNVPGGKAGVKHLKKRTDGEGLLK